MRFSQKKWNNLWEDLWQWALTVDDDPIVGEKVIHVWDFKRLAYDATIGDKWSDNIERPFYKNATLEDIAQAREWGNKMYSNPELVHRLHRLSRNVRGKFIDDFLQDL